MIRKALTLAQVSPDHIHEARNGRAGLNILAKHWIDILFVDINMPVMDGETMIRTVRSDPLFRELPIIVTSTEGSSTKLERLSQYHVQFVRKPFTAEQIAHSVLEVTGVDHVHGI
jgi:two-component system chemotaxis response regulator CheY